MITFKKQGTSVKAIDAAIIRNYTMAQIKLMLSRDYPKSALSNSHIVACAKNLHKQGIITQEQLTTYQEATS